MTASKELFWTCAANFLRYLDSAIDMASAWVEKGVVVSKKRQRRLFQKNTTLKAVIL